MSRITSVGRVTSAIAGRPEQREARLQLLRFLVIGSSAVLIDLGMYQLLTQLMLGTSLAKGLSYLTGMAFGFIGNKFWTFRSKSKSAAEPITYLVLYSVTLVVNVGLNALLLAALGAPFKIAAFLIATGTTTVMNFLGMKWFTFRHGIEQRQSSEGA